VVGVTVGETLVDVMIENDTLTLTAHCGRSNLINFNGSGTCDVINMSGISNVIDNNDEVENNQNMGGCPKIVTSKAIAASNLQLGLFEAATQYDTLMKKAERKSVRVQKGALKNYR
jgi:hypothetical protein